LPGGYQSGAFCFFLHRHVIFVNVGQLVLQHFSYPTHLTTKWRSTTATLIYHLHLTTFHCGSYHTEYTRVSQFTKDKSETRKVCAY